MFLAKGFVTAKEAVKKERQERQNDGNDVDDDDDDEIEETGDNDGDDEDESDPEQQPVDDGDVDIIPETEEYLKKVTVIEPEKEGEECGDLEDTSGACAVARLASGESYGADSTNSPDLNFVDHFSLRGPSSTVRFRGGTVKVYDHNDEQFVLEDHRETGGKHKITAKRMPSATFGLRVLRTGYTLVALLMLGFLFVFCFQLLLFLFLNLPDSAGGTTGGKLKFAELLGTILSIPLFLYTMGGIMAYGTTFLTDTWNGHRLFRSMMNWHAVLVEWFCFIIFLGIPAITICITLFMGLDDWWEVSAITWMLCVFFFYLLFSLAVVVCEFGACLETVALLDDLNPETIPENETGFQRHLRLAKRAMFLTQRQRFSGLREERYLVSGDEEYPKDGYSASEEHEPELERASPYSKFTQLSFLECMYDKLEKPTRVYSVEEIRDIVPFVTSSNWSLERSYCLSRNSRVIYSVNGPSALTEGQVQSTMICIATGLALITIIVLGCVFWMDTPTATVIVLGLLIVYCCAYPVIKSSWNVYQNYTNIRRMNLKREMEVSALHMGEDGEQEDDKGVLYQVWETVTVACPKNWVCWSKIAVDVVLFYLFPLIMLFVSKNTTIAVLYLFFGLFTSMRIYFDASFVLAELGSLDGIDIFDRDETEGPRGSGRSKAPVFTSLRSIANRTYKRKANRALLAKARTSEVMGNITRSRSAGRWMVVYGAMSIIILLMFIQAAGEGDTVPDGERPAITQVSDFYYAPQPDLPYPTCQLTKGFTWKDRSQPTPLGDFSYLAAISYEVPTVAQYYLDTWFGNGTAVDEAEFVDHYRQETGTVNNPVYYKLISFPEYPGVGVVAIRGSETMTDFLVDAQLWAAAFLAQLVRAFIPFGWLWTPILDDLVRVVNFVEDESLKKVSYYGRTTDFVNALLEDNYTYNGKSFHTIRITGASLGGGLAVITGAQTKANTVAISGLNGVLSRHTFVPPVTLEELNTGVFNVIPDRDIIARVGDRSRLFQEIQCRAPKNSLFACHSMWRTACELAFTCGTGDRPVMCQCVEKFGYPEPIQNGTRSFVEACEEETQKLQAALPNEVFRLD